MEVRNNYAVNKQASFGYNWSGLAKDAGSRTRKFVCTVPPKKDMAKAVGIGLMEAPKCILLALFPGSLGGIVGGKINLDAIEILGKVAYAYLTTKKSFTSVEGYLKTGPKALKLIKENPLNALGQFLYNSPFGKAQNYFARFKN